MINEAVILLGGMGTRLLPYTKTVSKEMLPIYDVPAIFLLVKEAYLSGIKRIIFVVTEHNKDLIKSFFSDDEYLNEFLKDKEDKLLLLKEVNEIIHNMEFIYVNQALKGTYGALYSAKDYIENDNFIVMYGDDLIFSDEPLTHKLISEFENNGKMQVAIYEKPYSELPKAGIVKLDNDNNLIDFVRKEKENSSCELHGRMLLNKKIFEIKDRLLKHDNDEYYLPHSLLNFKGKVKGFKYYGEYFNLGEKTGYIKASIYYYLQRTNDQETITKYLKKIL